MINSTIELPKITADFPAPVLANPLLPALPLSETYMMDCIAGMKHYPDKWFDLAVVDPPYGIGESAGKNNSRGSAQGANKFKNTRNTTGKGIPSTKFISKDWDNTKPSKAYIDELQRVSKNQIIFGANHFISIIPIDSSCWIIWDKNNGDTDFADCEIAWTSFKSAVRKFKHTWNGMLQQDMRNKEVRIHPTQKPVALYDWIFSKYAMQPIRCGQKHTAEYNNLCTVCNEPFKVLDTHLGSGSSRIAAHKNKLNFVGFEIDKEYFDKQEKRFANYVCQPRLF